MILPPNDIFSIHRKPRAHPRPGLQLFWGGYEHDHKEKIVREALLLVACPPTDTKCIQKKAAELNDTEAQAKVAYSYLQGIWSRNGDRHGDDRDEALKWYEIAADKGNATAQAALQECERAGKLYQKARQQSDLQTQIDLDDGQ